MDRDEEYDGKLTEQQKEFRELMEKANQKVRRLSELNISDDDLPKWDGNTFYKEGKIWEGRNPYIEEVQMVCDV